MDEIVFFDGAKERLNDFFTREFENFPPLIMSHFLNKFNDIMNYNEEDQHIKPKIIFTDNIEAVSKAIPKTYALSVFEDKDATMFNLRLKSLLAIADSEWCLYIEIKENKISYGLVMSFRSIKDKNFLQALEENNSLKDKQPKVHCIYVHALNFYTMSLHSVSGNDLIVNFSLDRTKNGSYANEIRDFVNSCFTKLRTTPRKLQDMQNMYRNIFFNVMNNVHGAICVVVDKDYKDNGLFADGVWLKEPISFAKLFAQSKSYSETKLQAFADLFINMLNFDGITIIDNQGRLRAYNVFVEPNSKKVGYIVGGARKRAAYYILSAKRKNIVGVYFQSHEGEVFFQALKNIDSANEKTKKTKTKSEKTAKSDDNSTKIKKDETTLKKIETATGDNSISANEVLENEYETIKNEVAMTLSDIDMSKNENLYAKYDNETT